MTMLNTSYYAFKKFKFYYKMYDNLSFGVVFVSFFIEEVLKYVKFNLLLRVTCMF